MEFESGKSEITRWALRPGPEEGEEFAGDVRGTLATRGIENTEVLTRVCDRGGNFHELVLQLRSGESSAGGDGNRAVHQRRTGRVAGAAGSGRAVCATRTSRLRVT